VWAEVDKINETLPPGMKITISYDSSVFIDRSIDNVFRTVAEAVILVVLVIFFFLRNLRATLIPLVTIPVSLVGAFALMYAFGFTINTLTLLAMVLAIGLVVDDAIVVLENIYRNIENGMERVEVRSVSFFERGSGVRDLAQVRFARLTRSAASAAETCPTKMASGKFHGLMHTHTPRPHSCKVLVSPVRPLPAPGMATGCMMRSACSA
jgi:hypothetical protein